MQAKFIRTSKYGEFNLIFFLEIINTIANKIQPGRKPDKERKDTEM